MEWQEAEAMINTIVHGLKTLDRFDVASGKAWIEAAQVNKVEKAADWKTRKLAKDQKAKLAKKQA